MPLKIAYTGQREQSHRGHVAVLGQTIVADLVKAKRSKYDGGNAASVSF